MKNTDCNNPPRCLPEDPGCPEQLWTWRQECEAIVEQPENFVHHHIPVDTSLYAPWWMYWTLGFISGITLAIGILFLKRGVSN